MLGRRHKRPTLSVCITAMDAERRLGMLLAEADRYADEVLVGVDVASSDGTWDVARAGADRAYRFSHRGMTGPARMAGLERARGDWVLFLDDDEGMDAAFPDLRDDLLGAPDVTHWWLPRRWLTSLDPPEFAATEPWWPDYSLRLTRNDPTRVWKPLELHSGLRVMGPRGLEPRTAILHYERIDHDDAARGAKVARYRALGHPGWTDAFYASAADVPRARVDPAPLRDATATAPRRAKPVVDSAVDDLELRHTPGWGAEVTVDMPGSATAGEVLFVRASACNTGTLRWAATSHGVWPDLNLGYRVRPIDGAEVPGSAVRAPVGRDTARGESAHFLCRLEVPYEPGEYELRWQLASSDEWFDALGSAAAVCRLSVRP